MLADRLFLGGEGLGRTLGAGGHRGEFLGRPDRLYAQAEDPRRPYAEATRRQRQSHNAAQGMARDDEFPAALARRNLTADPGGLGFGAVVARWGRSAVAREVDGEPPPLPARLLQHRSEDLPGRPQAVQKDQEGFALAPGVPRGHV